MTITSCNCQRHYDDMRACERQCGDDDDDNDDGRTADVALDDGHAVCGERAGLVGADGRRVAHRLARVQVTHQVVVQHHFLQAIVKYTVIQTGHLDVERISAQQGQNGGGGGGG